MKVKIVILVVLMSFIDVFACMSATQYKIFPIGVQKNKIIVADTFIYRGSNRDMEINWNIELSIAVYDFKGSIISIEVIDKIHVEGDHYEQKLKVAYKKLLQTIKMKYSTLNYFKPEYISFCDFQKKCEIITLKSDTIKKKDFLIYKNKKHQISLNKFERFKESALYSNSLTSYYISSTRVYKYKHIELAVAHLETGHEVSMGWITDPPNQKPVNEDIYNPNIISKEHKPKIQFNKLNEAIYEEPLLHHGYGFDYFVVNKDFTKTTN